MPISTSILELADITAAAVTLDLEADFAGKYAHDQKRIQAQTLRGVVAALGETTSAAIAQVESFVTVADVAADLDATFLQLSDSGGTVGVWIDVDDSGTLIPAGAGALTRDIEVTGVVTGDPANTVAIAVAAAIHADAEFTAAAVGNVVTVTQVTAGIVADGVDGDTLFTTFTVITDGAAVELIPETTLEQSARRQPEDPRETTIIQSRIHGAAGF